MLHLSLKQVIFIKGFWEKHSRIFLHIVDFNGDHRVEGPNFKFHAASKGLYMISAKE